MRIGIFGLLTYTFALACATHGFSHARFKVEDPAAKPPVTSSTPPRDASSGVKTAPCGGAARSTSPRIHKPGEEILVEWQETINHSGYYEIRFSKENDNFDTVLVAKIPDEKNDALSNGKYHEYSIKVKLPNINCDKCSLQLIQHMEDSPTRPYYSCSDIKLLEDTTPTVPMPPIVTEPKPSVTKPNPPTGLKIEKNK